MVARMSPGDFFGGQQCSGQPATAVGDGPVRVVEVAPEAPDRTLLFIIFGGMVIAAVAIVAIVALSRRKG